VTAPTPAAAADSLGVTTWRDLLAERALSLPDGWEYTEGHLLVDQRTDGRFQYPNDHPRFDGPVVIDAEINVVEEHEGERAVGLAFARKGSDETCAVLEAGRVILFRLTGETS